MTILLILVLISVAFLTLLERKLLGMIQLRKGPSKVGIYGIFQPFADAMKLFSKNTDSLMKSKNLFFFLSPLLFRYLSLLFFMFKLFIFGEIYSMSMMMILFLFSLSVYPSLMSGWSSNSKYSLIGGMRSIVQSLSYEITLSLIMFYFCILFSSVTITKFYKLNKLFFSLSITFVFFILLLMNLLIENSRSPFDLSEGESELVSGFNVEYGGLEFSLIFLGENSMVVFSALLLASISTSSFMSLSALLILLTIIVLRGSFPRFRINELLNLCWMIFIPFTLFCLIVMWVLI
uniref:NADH-ubiquinone oxidoreductase chain 1 n=1 Tax=Liposcelis entomophila TaxID=550478 RepID=A0A096X705_9NEOP|nr:NADH dehydrogenase subunit 1 [Liposcelis entomophila]AHA47071.1 NADH dehydrogenase subunit 1 [Liposcelis entomophila]